MNRKLYIEGGGDSKDLQIRCREAFRRLLDACGYAGRMPHCVACGGRQATFDDFKTAHANAAAKDYVAMLVDSEEPVADAEKPWAHLKKRDGWDRPDGATDAQALLMTTCMETWIATDRAALRDHYGAKLQESALPNLTAIESRDSHEIHDALAHATRDCKNRYQKGKRSFEALKAVRPEELRKHLPSFQRFERVLDAHL